MSPGAGGHARAAGNGGGPRRPRLAITLGDPRGIGPEIVERALNDERVRAACSWHVIGPAGTAAAVDEPLGRWSAAGTEAEAGAFAGRAVERAARMALAGEVDGIVTAPLDKHALLAGGFDYPGTPRCCRRSPGSRSR